MANNWAITVGINDYEFLPDASLQFAVNYALSMRSFLCEQAGFEKEQVLMCGDGQEPGTRKANRTTLRDVLKHQLQRAKGADNLWFFFSGHGMAGSRQDYLIPADGNPTDLEETALPLHFVTGQLRACQAKNIVLILDMCRKDVHRRGEKTLNLVGANLKKLVEEREGQQGIITLFSCGRGQSSFENKELRHGTFTHALLEGLAKHTLLKDLESYLERRVPELNGINKGGRQQVPLLIPEPGWKYEEPILNHYVTHLDITRLKETAMNAQLDGERQKALHTWQQINLLAHNLDDRRRALQQIQSLSSYIPPREAIETSEVQQHEEKSPSSSKVEQDLQSVDSESGNSLTLEKGISYALLCDQLRAGDWLKADEETLRIMLALSQRENRGFLNSESLKEFPCSDLNIIDQLWRKYSDRKYGFTIQKEIWDEYGKPSAFDESYKEFGVCIGWRQKGEWNSNFSQLDLNKPGVLPRFSIGGKGGGLGSASWRGRFLTFTRRISYCNLQ